ncbi:MAG: Gfo/Idh/MocA family oxidoreductase [Micrococcales bacterium]|nr:Gfo/Idh/MocA family oxidoreductase [Micrococcales bacterium]
MRTVLVGLGFIGHVHLDALRRLGVQVVGVLDATPELAKAEADAAGIPRAYRDLDELAADRTVDVVHVTSPNHVHAPQALALLRAGKNVVCEKPLAMNVAQGREMVAAAKAAGVVTAVGFHNRFYPMSAQAKAMVASGEVGSVRLVTGHYLQDWLSLETDWSWHLEPELGGDTRAVGDIGSHWIDLVEHVTGERIVEVLADFATFIPVRKKPLGEVRTFAAAGAGPTQDVPISTEDAALVLLRFDGGARGQFAVSQVSPGRANQLRYEVAGSQLSLGWESEHSEDLWIGRRGAASEVMQRDPRVVVPQAAGWLPAGHSQGLPDAFMAMYRAVYADIVNPTGGTPYYATFADGLRGLLVEDAILSSARTGAWTTVEGEGV